MMQFFELLFFHIYKSLIKSPDDLYKIADNSYPSLVALMILSFIELANFMAITIFLDIIGLRIFDFLASLNIGNWLPITLMLIFFIFNIIVMFDQDRYKKVIKKYSKKPLTVRKKGARITLIYGLGSIILVFVLAPIRVV